MARESTGVPHLITLTDDEMVTLRRVAFGESELRALRKDDVERLLKLRLIAEGRNSMVLTVSGREHFESLPRAVFAGRPRQREQY